MIPEIVYSKYSQAMFDIAKEQDKINEFGQKLRSIRDTLQMNPDLLKFVEHPLITPEAKKDTLKQIFADDVSPLIMQFLYVMIDRRRDAAIVAAIDGFIDLSRAAQNIEVAKIRLVKPLSAEEEKQLVASLEKMTGKHIDPVYTIDPHILGGMVVQIGDRLIDGSLRRQLQDMQHALLQSDVMNEVTDEQ